MKIGYVRVSTKDQNYDFQIDELKKEGCEQIFKDKISGTTEERVGLNQALSIARKGDVIVVWKLDRVGRSLKHLINFVNELNDRDIGFISLHEKLDTTTSTGKLMFHIFGALSEFERDVIRERTRAGLNAARARGKLGGRPQIMTEDKIKMANSMYKDKNISIKHICETLKISRATLYRYVKREQN